MSAIIIGGGPVGLLTSISLSSHGIPHTLFERYPGTSIHPKAVGLHQRTIEVLRALGLEDEILAHAAPRSSHARTAWYTDLGPDRREILSRDGWGGGRHAAEYQGISPCDYTILPQIRLEPILLARARELNPGGILHNAEVVDVVEAPGSDSVAVTVHHADTNETKTYSASYVIAADAGRTVGPKLGIESRGETDILDMVSAHIRAPGLRKWHPDPKVLIIWFIDPVKGGSIRTGYLYHLGPYNNSTEGGADGDGLGDEWMFACATSTADPRKFNEEDMLARLTETLKIPDGELDGGIEFLSTSHWIVNAVVADRFRSEGGRVFLVGDAAHRIPPWGALGLNTGVQDVHNLSWKLALSIKNGTELSELLDTYEEERRPIALRVAQTSLSSLRCHSLGMDRALGIDVNKSAAENQASFDGYFDKSHPLHGQMRDAVAQAQRALDQEFHAPGAEAGWFYPSADINNEDGVIRHDGQIGEDGEFDVCTYHPSTIPGHHMPHFWVVKDGVRRSTRDLVRRDKCVLFTKSTEWTTHLRESGLVEVQVLGGEGWVDEQDQWAEFTGVEDAGAVLVRPDGIVAWRSKEVGSLTREDIEGIIKRILKMPP
ncbi:FAD binding domain-containing protein [Aspergillus carlsbadensis]|nr:FAD binding domain-containing protein [Aspergillus carlsbadensis]